MQPFTRQDESPLYPQVLYNRPVTRGGAGRLLIPGGHTGELSQPTALFQLAMAAGAGECIIALPDAFVKLLSGIPGTTFLATSPSGSIGRAALGRLLELSEDVDGVAIGVSLSNNSETAIVLENFLREVERPVVAFDEAIALMLPNPAALIDNSDNLLVVTMPEIFKLADKLGIMIQIRPGGGLMNKLEIINHVALKIAAGILVYGTELIACVGNEEPVVTPINFRLSSWPAIYYALAATFWVQNRTNSREGLATAAYLAAQVSRQLEPSTKPTISDLAKLLRSAILDQEKF
jgi:hypothetical protein